MSTFGFDKDRFPNVHGEMFDCIICSCVVRNPKQCSGCGNLFCGTCIDDWRKKNSTCPNRCTGSINPMTSKALINIYNDLDIKCEKCSKVLKLIDLQKHQNNCGRTRCWNQAICESFQNKGFNGSKPICSQRCGFLLKLLQTNGNTKNMYKLLIDFKPQLLIPQKVGSMNNIPLGNSGQLKWDSTRCGTGIAFQSRGTIAYLKQSSYVFRSVITSTGFMNGQHYWEIHADNRTQNQLKIGVATTQNFEYNTAFCDHAFGFAFYGTYKLILGLGQLRHNSNASGPQYGKRFKKQGILGCYLNMDKGTLAFSLNGQSFGNAYQDGGLCKGPIFPAVSLLHCAACNIKGELPIPQIFKNL